MIFCSKFIKTITSSALLAGVAYSSFVSAYGTKLRRGISCNEDKDISFNDSKLEDLSNKDVTNSDDENLVKDDELDNYEDRVHKYNISNAISYEDTDSVDKIPTVNKHGAEKSVISKIKDNKSSSENSLLKSLDFKTVASIISASSSIGILSGLSKKLYFDKKVNPTKPDEPEPYIQDDDKNEDNPDPHKKEEKNNEPIPSPDTSENQNSNKKYLWITLGVFGFAVLVVMFIYRTRIMIEVFGWEKYVEKFHSNWSDWQKRFFYRKIFGYKKYIEKFSNDWWELYTEDYIGSLDFYSDEFHFILIKFVSEKKFEKQLESVYNIFSSTELDNIDLAFDIIKNPQNQEFVLKKIENEDVLLVKYGKKFLRFDILLYRIRALNSCYVSNEKVEELGEMQSIASSLFYCLINAKLFCTNLVPYAEDYVLRRKLDLSRFVESSCNNINISADCKNYVKNLYFFWLKKYRLATEYKEELEKEKYDRQIKFLDNLMEKSK